MALNTSVVQSGVLAHIQSSIRWDLVETGVPDQDTIVKIDGRVPDYVVIQFGDTVQRGSRNFAGTRNDDYEMPIYLQAISSRADNARNMHNKLVDVLLGFSVPFTGEVRKRPGGSMFPVHSSTGAAEAFMFPASFAVTLQLE